MPVLKTLLYVSGCNDHDANPAQSFEVSVGPSQSRGKTAASHIVVEVSRAQTRTRSSEGNRPNDGGCYREIKNPGVNNIY
jgi:hypothetical protein